MLIERNGGDAAVTGGAFIDVVRIESGISGEVGGKEAQMSDGLQIKRMKKGDVVLIEGQGIFGQDDIAVEGIGAGGNASVSAKL
jgi:hypothetical protein